MGVGADLQLGSAQLSDAIHQLIDEVAIPAMEPPGLSERAVDDHHRQRGGGGHRSDLNLGT